MKAAISIFWIWYVYGSALVYGIFLSLSLALFCFSYPKPLNVILGHSRFQHLVNRIHKLWQNSVILFRV